MLVYIFLLSASGNLLVYGESTYGPWSDWSDCNVDEGRGVMTRSRECVVDECPLPGEYVDTMACFVKPCNCECPISGAEESTTAGSELSTSAGELTTSAPKKSTSAEAEESTTGESKEFTTTGPEESSTGGTLAWVTEPTEPAMGSSLHSTTPAPTGIACEDNPLGAEDGGKLPSSSFKSSTSFAEFPPSSGRLHGTMAWCAADNTPGNEYLQIHVPEAKTICAISTQGSGYSQGTEYVTAYMLEFSDDGIGWQTLEEDGNVKVFDGNKDSKSVSKRVLPVPIEATYIRIYPLESEGWICMRAEVYGKESPSKPPIQAEEETTGPSTSEEETTVPSTSEKETTSPSTSEEETTGPTTSEEETTGPSTSEEEATAPFTSAEGMTGPTTSEEETTSPSTSGEETSASTTSEKEMTAPSTSVEETTAPSTSEEVTAVSTKSEEETTAPSTSEEGTTSPSTSEKETAAPSTSEKEATAPSTSEKETTSPSTSEIKCEDNPLGAEDGGKLPSSNFKSSTSFVEFPPSSGRLHGTRAWCAADNKPGNEYLQIHVPEAKTICAIATQGQGSEYVTAYMLKFSDDGIGWQTLEEDGNVKVFDGNNDAKSVSKQVLPVPIEATYIRIYPLESDGWTCMRAEVYGKEKKTSGPTTSEEETTSPSTSEEETTSPTTSEKETTGPSTSEEVTTGPSTSEEGTTGPTPSEEEPTGPATSEEGTTGPTTSEGETTGPTTSVAQCGPVGAAYGGSLPDSSFAASTEAGQDYAAHEGRLNGMSAWCPNRESGAYLQIKLPFEMEICGVETQGIKSFGAWVTKYNVYVGDGAEWKFVQKTFDGNTYPDEPSFQPLPDPMTGQYIRIYPLKSEESPCMRVEIYAKATTTTAPYPTEQKNTSEQEPTNAEPIPTGASISVPTTPSKGIDIGILVDSSFGVTSEEFEKLKLFISELVDSITDHYGSSVQFGFVVYSDEPDLVMTLKMFSDVDVSGIIRGIKYIPGEGHRTDLAMLKATRELFCSEGCGLRSEGENVLIVFTSENNDAGSFPYSFISPKMKDASLNIIAIGIKQDVGQSELTKIALGSTEHVIKVPSPNDLDSSVVAKIEKMISQGQAEPNTSGPAEQEVDSKRRRRFNFRNA